MRPQPLTGHRSILGFAPLHLGRTHNWPQGLLRRGSVRTTDGPLGDDLQSRPEERPFCLYETEEAGILEKYLFALEVPPLEIDDLDPVMRSH